MKAFVHQLGFLYCELVKLHGSRALAVNMLACGEDFDLRFLPQSVEGRTIL